MTSSGNHARFTGVLYLLLVLAAPIRLIYIPSKLFVTGDPAATAANILQHEALFRFGIAADLFCGTLLIFLLLALYKLFKGVHRDMAVLMVILGGVLPACIDYFNVLNDAAALMLARGGGFLAALGAPERHALAMLFLRLHGQEILAAEILWGLWLFPLAFLVHKSRSMPRFMGLWLAINGVAYLALSFTGILLPSHEDLVAKIAFPAQLGEIAFMLWLLVAGVKVRADAPAA